jgi:uncharacterized membrane protein YbhN (UPF0104 family)
MGSIVAQVPRRALVASAAVCGVLVVLALVPHAFGPRLASGFAALPRAHPLPLWCGCGLFVVSLLCSAGAWRTIVAACGGRIGRTKAAASYGVGSLANSLLPARLGDAVRVGLFSRALPQEDRVWTTSGIFLAMGVARAFVLFGLVVAATAVGAVPVGPVTALGALLALAAAVVVRVRRTQPRSHVSHLLDAFRALGRSPSVAGALAGWTAGSMAARVGAAAATASALGVHSPLLAALVIVPALELASLLPLTPGNVGIASGAITVALHATGTDLGKALSVGIGLHAVEMAAGLGFGASSALYFAGTRSPRARRFTAVAGAAAALGAAAIVGALIIG